MGNLKNDFSRAMRVEDNQTHMEKENTRLCIVMLLQTDYNMTTLTIHKISAEYRKLQKVKKQFWKTTKYSLKE